MSGMYLTQKNHLRGLPKSDYQILRQLTHLSKNLYNHTLYTVRQYYFANESFLQYEQAYHYVKADENYERLPLQVAQQTMRVVNRSMRSFFRLLRERTKGNYNRPIRLPGYLPKDGYFNCIFPKDMFKVKGKRIRISLGLSFAKNLGIRYLYFKANICLWDHLNLNSTLDFTPFSVNGRNIRLSKDFRTSNFTSQLFY